MAAEPPRRFDVDNEPFEERITRVHELLSRIESENGALPLELAHELAETVEQLQVAREELITQHEELEDAYFRVQKSEERYQTLFEHAPDGYLLTNEYGIIQQANRRAAALLNYEADHLRGKPLIVFVTRQERARFRAWLNQLAGMTGVQERAALLHPRVSPPIPVLLTVQYDENGLLSGRSNAPVLRWMLRDLSQWQAQETAERTQLFRDTFQQAAVGMKHCNREGRYLHVNQKYCDMLGYTAEELLGRSFLDNLHPDDVDESWEVHQDLFRGKLDPISHEKRIIHKTGRVIWTRISSSILRGSTGEPLYRVAVIQDVTEQKRAVESEREQRELAQALHDTALSLTSTLDLNEVLSRILDNAGRVVPHDAADIMFLEDTTVRIVQSRGHPGGQPPEPFRSQGFVLAESPAFLRIIHDRSPLIIPNISQYPGWIAAPGQDWLRAIICTPIISQDEILGFITLNSRHADFFTAEHARRLRAFAADAAIAIRNAHLLEQAKLLAATEERQYLARELHDAVSQTLFTANILAEALPRLSDNISPVMRDNLEKLRLVTRSAMAEMRILLMELRPEHLLTNDFTQQLQQLIDAARGKKAINIDLITRGTQPLPPDVHIAFYRITQEALNNITKHSQASQVEILYRASRRRASITIQDNGQGFDVEQAKRGMGLHSLRERAHQIGAALEIRSALGQGTMVALTWRPPPKNTPPATPDDEE